MIDRYGGNLFGVSRQETYPDRSLSQKEWNAYLKELDSVEEEILREIRQEGEENLQVAQEQRQQRRENWKEQWESRLARECVMREEKLRTEEQDRGLFLERDEADRLQSVLESTVQADRLKEDKLEEQAKDSELWAPYEELSTDGGLTITYNGVTFQCNRETHTITLGDMSQKENIINIPLSGGGCLMVNKNNIAELGRAIGMFTSEDIGSILRAIAEYEKITSMEYEMEEDEADTLENMADKSGMEEENGSAGELRED